MYFHVFFWYNDTNQQVLQVLSKCVWTHLNCPYNILIYKINSDPVNQNVKPLNYYFTPHIYTLYMYSLEYNMI